MRGRSAARLMRPQSPSARRVVVKTRIVKFGKDASAQIGRHLRYIEREGVGRNEEPGDLYDATHDTVDRADFESATRGDRHQFRFIVSAEEGERLTDLKPFTRELLGRMERDLGTKLEWVANDHHDTDNPHTHIVVRGKADDGRDLVIDRDYLTQGIRARASELATQWLGKRSEHEIATSLEREVTTDGWTSLDEGLTARASAGCIVYDREVGIGELRASARELRRLAVLETWGLATRQGEGEWRLAPNLEDTLRERSLARDVIKTMARKERAQKEGLQVAHGVDHAPVVGRIIDRGIADELTDQGFLSIEGFDGKAHLIRLPASESLQRFPLEAIVEVRFSLPERTADRNIARIKSDDGFYRPEAHQTSLEAGGRAIGEARSIVTSHVRRLEALRRGGIVERSADGAWQIPPDFTERARAYDLSQHRDPEVSVHSSLSLKRQATALGATWLDSEDAQHRAQGASELAAETRRALTARQLFLAEEGFIPDPPAVGPSRAVLTASLRRHELAGVAARITRETGLQYRELSEHGSVRGTYRQTLNLVSGRFAMLDDAVGFSLVPWRPVIEGRFGQTLTATLRGESIDWQFGRDRGRSI